MAEPRHSTRREFLHLAIAMPIAAAIPLTALALTAPTAESIVAGLQGVGLKPYAGWWRGELELGVYAPEPIGFGKAQMAEMNKFGAWLRDHPERRQEFARAVFAAPSLD